jgi:hypothetical protein
MSVSGAGTGAPDPGTSPEVNPDAPEGGQGVEEVDWSVRGPEIQRSYDELRPRWTQDTQRLSEYEQLFEALSDPEQQAEVLQRLGFELDTGAEPKEDVSLDEFEDPLEKQVQELTETVTELRSARELEAEEREQNELVSLRDDYIGEAIDFIEQETGKKFSEKAEEVLGNLAIQMERDDGVPDVQAAYNVLYGKEGILEDERSGWIQGKTGAVQAPRGSSAPAIKKPQTAGERVQYFDERLRAAEQDQ